VDLERDRRHFDHWAPQYDRSLLQPVFFSPIHVATLSAATKAGAHPHDVLDLGCGTGRLLERAADRWPDARFVGIDVSSMMIEQARRKHSGEARFRFEVADAAGLPLAPASVDVALTTLSFHHWADQLGGVREVARVLRPNGLFILADIRPPVVLRPILRRFHASRSRQKLFREAGLTVAGHQRPWRLGGTVLITVGRKA